MAQPDAGQHRRSTRSTGERPPPSTATGCTSTAPARPARPTSSAASCTSRGCRPTSRRTLPRMQYWDGSEWQSDASRRGADPGRGRRHVADAVGGRLDGRWTAISKRGGDLADKITMWTADEPYRPVGRRPTWPTRPTGRTPGTTSSTRRCPTPTSAPPSGTAARLGVAQHLGHRRAVPTARAGPGPLHRGAARPDRAPAARPGPPVSEVTAVTGRSGACPVSGLG